MISDKKIGVSSAGSIIDYYKAEVLSQVDYYPFGMSQPGRQFSAANGYRYGFNGKENETDIPGWQDYGMREYDRLTGRFISVDPLTQKYPELTPYQFAGNKPIAAIDLDGLETWLQIQGNQLERQYKITNDIQVSRLQQQRQSLLQTRTVVGTADPCEWCTVQRTNIAKQARHIAAFKQSIGPVGGGGTNFGLGMASAPIVQATAQGMVFAAMGIPFGAGIEAGAFSSFRALGKSLISLNSLESGLGNAAANFTVQSVMQLSINRKISFSDYNFTGIAVGFLKSPITSNVLSSGLQMQFQSHPFQNSLFGNKPISQFGIESGVGILFNNIGSKSATYLSNYYGEFQSSYIGGFIGEQASNASLYIYQNSKSKKPE